VVLGGVVTWRVAAWLGPYALAWIGFGTLAAVWR
jgi:hypothetical protein